MNGNDLHGVLDRATDAVEPLGLATQALSTARRRRARRRGLAAGVVSAVAVIGIVVAAQGGVGTSVNPAPAPATDGPSTSAVPRAPEPVLAPPIPEARIQPQWDPRGVEALPVLDLGVPRVLPVENSGSVTTAVALLDDGEEALLVGPDGAQMPLVLPDAIGSDRTVVLSIDGRRVATTGRSGLYWRDLDGGSWTKIDVPEHARSSTITWIDDTTLILLGYGPGVRVDLATGGVETMPQLSPGYWGADPDGRVAYLTNTPASTLVIEQPDGSVLEFDRGPLESIAGYALSDRTLAAIRANGSIVGGVRKLDDVDGLIALDRTTLETLAFLPVPDSDSRYTDGGGLRPVTWLEDTTLLFTVNPVDNPKRYLVAWNTETGELSRIACWPEQTQASFATDVLSVQ